MWGNINLNSVNSMLLTNESSQTKGIFCVLLYLLRARWGGGGESNENKKIISV